jgi:hypothetical protein
VWSIDSELRETGIGLIDGGFGFGSLQASVTLPIPIDTTSIFLLEYLPAGVTFNRVLASTST